MDIPSIVVFLWMLFGKISSTNSETTKFLATLEVDVSSIPVGHSIIAEENKSIVSCGLKCLEDDYCVGFGFIRKPGTKCLVVANGFMQTQITQGLEGYTYYSKDNIGEDKFRVLLNKMGIWENIISFSTEESKLNKVILCTISKKHQVVLVLINSYLYVIVDTICN